MLMSIKCHKQYTVQATGHVIVFSILALDYTQLKPSGTQNRKMSNVCLTLMKGKSLQETTDIWHEKEM